MLKNSFIQSSKSSFKCSAAIEAVVKKMRRRRMRIVVIVVVPTATVALVAALAIVPVVLSATGTLGRVIAGLEYKRIELYSK